MMLCARPAEREYLAASALRNDLANIGSIPGTCTGRGAVMQLFFLFSAAIGDRCSAAIGAAACRDRSDR